MTTERDIQARVWEGVGREGATMFRNNVGAFKKGHIIKRFIRFGLLKGSADLIGWTSVIVTHEMIGKKIAVFTSLEIKKKTGKAKKDQIYWAGRVRGDGGYAGIVRSLAEALRIVRGE